MKGLSTAITLPARRDRASELFPALAFEPERKLFLLADNSIGFGFLCQPAVSTENLQENLNVLLNLNWPTGTLLQFTLWTSPDIEPFLAAYHNRRFRLPPGEARERVAARARFIRDGAREPLEPYTGARVRDIQLLITAKLPLAGVEPTERELGEADDRRNSMEPNLRTAGFGPVPLEPEPYLRFMASLLNWGADAGWRESGIPLYRPDQLLCDQILDFDTALRVEQDGLWLGDRRVTVLSVKQYPERVFLGNALRYLGDMTTGTRGVRENLLITATVLIPDAVNSRAALERSGQWVAHQTYSPLLKFVPKLAKRKQGFDLMRDAMDNGDRPVRLYLGFVLFTASREEAVTAVSNLQTFYRENGLQVLPDRYFCLPLFLHCLPFGGDRQVIKETHRYRTWATRHVAPLLPVLGDWKGTGAPVLTLFSRNGQAMGLDLFQSRSNYNCVIAAASGKGKSFLANQLIESYLETGGRVWVIDVGRSYQKLARVLHGEFLEFKNDGSLRINPFELVRDYSDEEDMLVGLLSAMIAPTRPLADLQTAELKRLLKQAWDSQGHDLTLDDMAAALLAEQDPRVSDMGRQLYAFTREGQYGRFFSGASNVRLEADFIVIELTELKGRKHLQQVVLLLIIYQIQQVMYQRTDELERRKLVLIDEAWDLLGAGDVGLFIETGYRRFRKQNGAAVTITQGLQDLYDSPGGRAIIDNSANRLLLGQSPDAITALEKAGRLASLGGGGYLLLRTVHTQPGAYAEVLCLTEFGAGVGRVIVDPYTQLLYSTKPADVSALQELMAQGLTQDQAIRTLLERRRTAP